MSDGSTDIKVAVIGGSGLGAVLAGHSELARHVVTTPFGPPSGPILETNWEGVPVLLLSRHGPGHVLNPSAVNYRANIYALKQLGATHVIASGAVGSLRDEIRPRDLVVLDQVIDKTTRRAHTFYERAAVHVEFAQPFCPALRSVVLEAAKSLAEIKVHDKGTYVCMEGPAFSTRAESLMHRLWGGDVIGMTAMPEAKLAREAELSYCMVALATDYDAWKARPTPKEGDPAPPHSTEQALLEEIIGHLNAATSNAMALIRAALKLIPHRAEVLAASPARHALKLGIWSDKKQLDPEEIRRLSVLWGRYFDAR
jgi:5'-methylthioadenosine phosphorylase